MSTSVYSEAWLWWSDAGLTVTVFNNLRNHERVWFVCRSKLLSCSFPHIKEASVLMVYRAIVPQVCWGEPWFIIPNYLSISLSYLIGCRVGWGKCSKCGRRFAFNSQRQYLQVSILHLLAEWLAITRLWWWCTLTSAWFPGHQAPRQRTNTPPDLTPFFRSFLETGEPLYTLYKSCITHHSSSFFQTESRESYLENFL